jgi:flagellar FliJ protein
MTRSQRLTPVQNVVESAERKLAQSLAAHERRLAEAQDKLSELTRYRGEYEQQLAQRASSGIGVAELRDYQAFLARLTDAVRQQQAVAHRVRAERDAERLRWQDAATRVKAVEHVVTQWRNEERRSADRREQHEIDERAQRITKRELQP